MTRDIRDSQGRDWRCYNEGRVGGVSYGRLEEGAPSPGSQAMVRCYAPGGWTALFPAPLDWHIALSDDELGQRIEKNARRSSEE